MQQKLFTPTTIKPLLAKLHAGHKQIVLVGGCFDIIHAGHIAFLTKAKEQGDTLIVLLESDKTIQNLKGNDRPIHTQKDRAIVLAALGIVDYIVLLPRPFSNYDYDQLAIMIKPAIIATTAGDSYISHKKRQALLTGAQVVAVTKRTKIHSTSAAAALIVQDL